MTTPFRRRPSHAPVSLRSGHRARRRHPAGGDAPPVLLVGAGTHAATLVPVLQDLPEGTDLAVVLRMATREDLAHGAALAELTLRRGGRLVELSGARSAVALDAARLSALVGDVGLREVHAAGPAAFVDAVLAGARDAGAPAVRSHGAAVPTLL